MSVRRHTFEERVAKFKIFRPVRDFLVEQFDAALHKWVREESYTCDEGCAFDDVGVFDEKRHEQERRYNGG